jgi:hypothetical protein
MRNPASTEYLDNLRFALSVMQERSHLGLDDQRATVVQNALLHRIALAEDQLGYVPAGTLQAPVEEPVCA